MAMSPEQMKQRTKQFAIRIIRLVEALPNDKASVELGRQLLRAGTSVGANYRAACRAKSPRDFVHKLGIVEEESDEASFWMELLIETERLNPKRSLPLLKESNEILAMVVASINTVKRRSQSAIRNPKSAIKEASPQRA
jgi:four helix bundle protein